MEFCKMLFDRSSLYQTLNQSIQSRKIIYISAHAGWGKTIALMDWARKQANTRYMTAKETLTYTDGVKKAALFVIDDLQDITDDELQTNLLPLLAEVSNKKYILISRAALPSLLCPLKLSGQLVVLDQAAFLINRDVIDSYLAQTDIPYSVENSSFLIKEGKGYPVAIDCLAELLQSGAPCTQFTAQKATQAVYDYLEQAVFARFAPQAQSFLLQIAQFSTFTLRMAVMISNDSSIIQVLEEITHRGKCIVPAAPECYSIPFLFQRFLLHYQKRKCPDSWVAGIWRKAGFYYESCDNIPQALHCYQQVNDWDKLVELLIRHTRRPPYTTYYFELKEYYLALPAALIEQSPELMCSISMIYSMSLQVQESEYWYNQLEEYSRCKSRSDTERKTAAERLAYLRITLPHRGSKRMAQTILDITKLLQGEDQCLQCISPTSGLPSLMHGAKDFCNWSRREEPLYYMLKKPIELLLGKAGIGVADAGLAESKLERCTLKSITGVMLHATSALNQTEQSGTLDVYFAASATIARLAVMQGDLHTAQKNIDYVYKKAQAEGNTRLLSNIQAFQVRIFLLEGKTAEINRWMQESAPDEIEQYQLLNRYQYMVKARCYILRDETLEAITLLMRMIPYFERSEQYYCLMEAQMLLAIVQYRMEQDGWNVPLEQALTSMERFGFLRLPAEEGAALLPLLNAIETEPANHYRQMLIREVARYAQLYPVYLQQPSLPIQALTQTEKQVLHLLIQGLKNAEIAQALRISIRTVKFHTGNIYAKLNVNSRTEAIAQSRKLFE